MSMREVRAAGYEALRLATVLLQRARLADPQAGLWEAADMQWAWRTPRRSDEVEKLLWLDAEGPVAGVLLTSWTDEEWQCDPVIVPRASPEPGVVWERAMEQVAELPAKSVEVPVDDEDRVFLELAQRSGLTVGDQDSTAWMDAADRPAVPALPEGFVLADRTLPRLVWMMFQCRSSTKPGYGSWAASSRSITAWNGARSWVPRSPST